VESFVERHGLEKVGFLTTTFADHVLDPKEAQRRLHSLSAGVLNQRYRGWIRVFERQKSGRIHYHLLVALDVDIRTGCDFEAFAQGDYRTAPASLRREWKFWRDTAKLYRFGRTELLPIRTTVQAAARYIGKYIGKHMGARQQWDKGVRLVAYSRGSQSASTRFAWATEGREWRRGVDALARIEAARFRVDIETLKADGLSSVIGKRWGWDKRELVWLLASMSDERIAELVECWEGRASDRGSRAI
jgi:hypothetical protein